MTWTLDTAKPGFKVKDSAFKLAQAAIAFKLGDVSRGTASIFEAVTSLGLKDPSLGQLAAQMWLEVMTLALANALKDARPASQLTDREKCTAFADTLRPIFEKANGQSYGKRELENPVCFAPCAQTIADFPGLLRRIDPEATLSDDEARRLADLGLRKALIHIAAKRYETYAPVLVPQSGPAAEAARRWQAWRRRADWIIGQVERDPLPLREDAVTLHDVYILLRCHYHDQPEQEPGERGPSRKNRRTHVAWLHETAHAWLADSAPHDALRLVAGGPGSGKSSFARAFAREVLHEGRWNVALVQLQHLTAQGDLHEDIDRYFKRRGDGAGLHFNPLETLECDGKPLLLIFDGLDELARSDALAEDVTRRFVDKAQLLLRDHADVRALILGRGAAMEPARREAEMAPQTLLHVLKLTPVTHRDLGVEEAAVIDPGALCALDQRAEAWPRWRRLMEAAPDNPPEALLAEDLEGLNAEPLLMYLLIISGYAGARWPQAQENRNRVYAAIFDKVYARDRDKLQPAGKGLNRDDFFTLMECLGLAAWRGGGRTGSDADFIAVRDKRCGRRFENVEAATLKNVATQFYTRQDIDEPGYQFIHKSFGEYLTGRALLRDGFRIADRLADAREEEVAPDWLALTGPAEMTHEVLRFLRDAARLAAPDRLTGAQDRLTGLMNWAIRHGFPAHRDPAMDDWRAAEAAERHAVGALLAVLNALTLARRAAGADAAACRIALRWGDGDKGARAFLDRLRVTDLTGRTAGRCLSGVDFSTSESDAAYRADLFGANLMGAELSGADLGGADLSWANLSRAELFEADLGGATLSGADLGGANLSGANLSRADLIAANLRRADLSRANLREANLREADLTSASCKRAKLQETYIQDADLSQVRDLTAEQINSAHGDAFTKIPRGLHRPAHWTDD